MGRRFVFVDRDGTLVEDRGYAHALADYARLPGADEGLRLLQSAGFAIAIVTNQSGIARGYYTERDFERFQEHLIRDFASCGVNIAGSYHCPHLPDAGCACRKPEPGLLERARVELDADLAASWVIGDSASDVELATRAGCRGVLVLTGEHAERRGEIPSETPVAVDLMDAARQVLSAERRSAGAR